MTGSLISGLWGLTSPECSVILTISLTLPSGCPFVYVICLPVPSINDIDVTSDFPETIYVSVAADFFEELYYYDYYYYYYDYDSVSYSDEYVEMATLYIDDGERVAGDPGGEDPVGRFDNSRTDFPFLGITALNTCLPK